MLKNYLKMGFRSIGKNKVYGFINAIGLTIGLWACLMVSTVVINDLSYDRQWSRAEDIYRIISVKNMGAGVQDRFTNSWVALPAELQKLYPEVKDYASIEHYPLRLKFREGDENGVDVMTLMADTSVWKILDLKVVQGNPRRYQAGNSNIMITESFRDRFFKGKDVVGDIFYDIPAYGGTPNPYLITGVIKDLNSNSHLRADVVYLWPGFREQLNKSEKGGMVENYLLMKPGTDMGRFTTKVNKWYANFVEKEQPSYRFEFQPMTEVYLHSDFAAEQQVKGSIRNIYIFSGVAALLLLIACINFINLSTARSLTRLHETGVRKVLGSGRRQLVMQFLTESLLFFAIASVLAFSLYLVSLGPLENFLGHPLAETFVKRLPLFAGATGVILLISLLTGVYPAWLLSGFKPAMALKGNLLPTTVSGQAWLRKGLVILQFSISIVVLVAMIVVQQQLKFMENKDIGFNEDNLLSIGYISWDGKGEAIKQELLRIPGVESASISSWTPTDGLGEYTRDVEIPGENGNKIKVSYISGDADLAKTLGLRLKKGRLLDVNLRTDAINSDSIRAAGGGEKAVNEQIKQQPSLITAATAKTMGITALNQIAPGIETKPVGIIEDMNVRSLKEPLMPVVIRAEESREYGGMLVRITPGLEKQAIAGLKRLWERFYPQGKKLELNWISDLLQKQYETEEKLSSLFALFSGLAMFLAALGIFGLVVHAATQRTKEIGIRKVLGASVAAIVTLLSKDFIKLVLLAILIATPLAWYASNRWLQDFAYRIELEWWMFALAGLLAAAIALLTVSFQSVKAALANPVKSLRSE